MTNGHGGARPGSGRKPGSVTRKTREIADRAVETGSTPLEVMLETMRLLREAAFRGSAPDVEKLVQAAAVAKDAAPYIHPRLSSVEAQVAITGHEAALAELA